MAIKNNFTVYTVLLFILTIPSIASAKYIHRVLLDCSPLIIKDGEKSSCSAKLLYSDNSTKNISTSSISNWKTTNSNAAYINAYGVITGKKVSDDTSVTIEAEYYDSSRSSPYVSGFASVKVIGSGNPFTNFYISCPSQFNEGTSAQCKAYATINNKRSDVTNQTTWREQSSYTTISQTGYLTASRISSDTGVNVTGTYSYNGTSRSDSYMVTLKNTVVPSKYLTNVLLNCPDSLQEGKSGQCTATAKFSDNTTANASPLKNCSGTNSYAAVSSSGKVTASQVSGNKNFSLECGYTYNGKTMTGIDVIKITDAGNPFTSFYISCPAQFNENTSTQCSAYATINNRRYNVTNQTTWKEKSSYTTISSTGYLTASSISSDTGSEVIGTYTYQGTSRSDDYMVTVKNLVAVVTPSKYLTKVLLDCPYSLQEGKSGQCSATAKFSDNTTANASPLTNCSGTNSYASVSSSGKITASQVLGNKIFSLECSYTYNGKTMTGIDSLHILDATPKGFTAFRIACPTSLDEHTNKQCNAYATVDGVERNVSSSSTWSESSNYISITSNGFISANEVSGNSGAYIYASYNYGNIKKSANQIITINDLNNNAINVDTEIPIDTGTTTEKDISELIKDGAVLSFINRYTNKNLVVDGNSEWILKFQHGKLYTICESKNPDKCLSYQNGKLVSDVYIFGGNIGFGYYQWSFETENRYIKIENSPAKEAYIHNENTSIDVGNIQSGWWSAQWSIEDNKNSSKQTESFEFISKSNNSIKLTVGGNSDWVIKKDTIYGTDAYKICDKNRADFCLNMEHNNVLENSQIQDGWYSALWTIKKLPDGNIFIRSKWKENKYISINTSGATLTIDKDIKTSSLEKSNFLSSILSLFISNANAELKFGETLAEFIKLLDDKEIWEIKRIEKNTIQISIEGLGYVEALDINTNTKISNNKDFSIDGTKIKLIASNEGGYLFAGWFGEKCLGDIYSNRKNECEINISKKSMIKAIFVSPDGDFDKDGLLNKWEINGYTNSNGFPFEVDLPKMGANALRKDIFVEVDYMKGMKPKEEYLEKIVQSFNNSPVENTYAKSGIALHIDLGEDSKMNERGDLWGNQSDSNMILTIDVIEGNNANELFDAISDSSGLMLGLGRENIFRHALFGKRLLIGGDDSLGVKISKSAFIVALFSKIDIDADNYGDYVSAVFMHELGHTLGLKHGGGDNINYKPNYLSIMNYSFISGLITNIPDRKFDYSRKETISLPLDENSLDENSGLYTSDRSALDHFGTKYYCVSTLVRVIETIRVEVGGLSNPIDWNCNGILDEERVISSINGNRTIDNDLHESFDDWGNLDYILR